MNETNRNNQNVMKKTFKTVVIVLTILELLAMGFFTLIFSVLSKDFGGRAGIDLTLVRNCFLIGIPVIAIVVDIALYCSYKTKTAIMSDVKAIECVVEDIIITSYLRDHERKYKLIPVVKNTRTGELFCTFGKYNMSFYSSAQGRNANSLLAACIVRDDGSAVEIGDTVRVYIKESVNVNVIINPDNTYSLNGQKHNFNHENQKYDIELLNKLNFFKGIIDVEQ